MKHLILILVLVGWTGPALALTCITTQSTPEFVEMNLGGNLFRIHIDSLRQGSDDLRAADLRSRITGIVQFRGTRADLDIDDPDRVVDPGGTFGELMYWCDVDGNPTPQDDVNATHVCSSGDCVISNIIFEEDGSAFISLRNGRDCSEDPTFPSCL